MNTEQLAGFVRHVLTGAGTYFGITFLADGNTVGVIAGGVATVVGLAWSWFAKRRTA